MSWFKNIFLAFSSKEKLVFVLTSGLLVVSGFFLVGIFVRNNTKPAPASGGEYSEAIVGQPAFINPLLADTFVDKTISRLAFASVSDLSEKIESDKSGKIWKVRLKEGLRWSDGEKLTSDDVIFTLQKIQDPQTSSPFFGSWQGVVANRASELEVQFNLSSPYGFFADNLSNLYPVPKHIFADTPASNWRLAEYNLEPVGSGAYVFESLTKKEDGFISEYILHPNKFYAGNQPFIGNLTFNFFTNQKDAIASFNSGFSDGLPQLAPEDLSQIKRTYDLHSFPLSNYYAVFLNQSQNSALEDEELRKALSLAVDRDAIINEALLGYGKKQAGPLPQSGESSDSQNFNEQRAVEILEGIGWKVGENGIREKKNKNEVVKLQIELLSPSKDFLKKTAEMVADDWRKIGVEAKLQVVSAEDLLANQVKNRSYQALLFGNLVNSSGDLFSFWHSSERFYPGLNLSIYNNKNVDKLIEDVRESLTIENKNAAQNELLRLIDRDVPAVFLYSQPYLFLTTKDIQGISTVNLEDFSDRAKEMRNWYVKVARTFK
jgi:peptide/nickel transport system substrate-binding protein